MAGTESTKDRLLGLLNRGKDLFLNVIRKGRLRISLYELERTRINFLQRLGELTYPLIKEGKIDLPDLNKIFIKIQSLEDEIEKEKERFKKVKKEEAVDDESIQITQSVEEKEEKLN